jgi:DNA polymerase III gamma/tau subunit
MAVAADGSFRDALGTLQKVMMASKDASADGDEVAAIIGAPKSSLLRTIIVSLSERNAENALKSIGEAVEAHVDMRLFMRLLLERVRAIILARHDNTHAGEYLDQYGEDDKTYFRAFAEDKQSPIHSHLLLRLLEAAEQSNRMFLPQLPLELAVVELCNAEKKI